MAEKLSMVSVDNEKPSNTPAARKTLKSQALFVIIISLFIGGLWVYLNSGPDEKEFAKAQGIAYQILEIRRKALIEAGLNSRGPASVVEFTNEGRIGKSADGSPYHYSFKEQDQEWIVQIWPESNNSNKTEVRIRRDRLKEN